MMNQGRKTVLATRLHPYAFQLSSWLKTEAGKSQKQRRSLKRLHEELVNLGLRGLTTASRRSPDSGGRVKRSGSIRRANEHTTAKSLFLAAFFANFFFNFEV